MEPKTDVEMLKIFQKQVDHANRVVFVGHPGSAGMGLTLTASPTIVYWSNDFNAESRIQSEDRIHRAGMDVNRGATIVDLIHLPTDLLVLENLKKKRELQNITFGELQECLDNAGARVV
jgi:SNF2 family DNA or RNA helicase